MRRNLDVEHEFRAAAKAAREALGMSQRALAQRLGVDPATVARIETGGRGIRLNEAAAIAAELDIPLVPTPSMPAAFKSCWAAIVTAREDLRVAELAGKIRVDAAQAALLAAIGELQALAGLAAVLTSPDDAARAVIQGADTPEQP